MISILLLLSTLFAVTRGRDVYVDILKGDDLNEGSSTTPLKTLAAAWNMAIVTQISRITVAPGDYSGPGGAPNYWENVQGQHTSPIVIESQNNGTRRAILGSVNMYKVRNIVLSGFQVQGGGDVVHCELCENVTFQNLVVIGYEAQEGIKLNQCKNINVTGCDVSNAWDNALDLVAVNGAVILNNSFSNAGDWCGYAKGGSFNILVKNNTFQNCGNGGFTAGQGTGFQWMVPPFLTYEAVGLAIVGNFVKNANGAAFGVNGGFNVLIARNTATQVGATSHLLEVVFGGRSCDGQPGDEGRERCQQYLNASNMGWGTTGVDTDVRIPNNHVTIFGNCIVNEAPYKSEWQQFTIFGATGSQPGSNVPSNARADNDLLISRNIIWNGNADMPLGVGDDSCNNLICNSTQLVRDNSINVAKPELANATGGRMTCVDFPGILSQVRKPNWSDRPAGLPIAFEDWPGLDLNPETKQVPIRRPGGPTPRGTPAVMPVGKPRSFVTLPLAPIRSPSAPLTKPKISVQKPVSPTVKLFAQPLKPVVAVPRAKAPQLKPATPIKSTTAQGSKPAVPFSIALSPVLKPVANVNRPIATGRQPAAPVRMPAGLISKPVVTPSKPVNRNFSKKDVYVDILKGDDLNEGSSTTPLKTLAAAWNMAIVTQISRITVAPGDYSGPGGAPNYWENVQGQHTSPIVIESQNNGTRRAILGSVNMYKVRNIVLSGFQVQGGGDVVHCELCENVTFQNLVVIGYEAQEGIKLNQCKNINVTGCDVSNAWDNALDLVAVNGAVILNNSFSNAGDWCGYAKGGSFNILVKNNTFQNCGNGGFTAGQGTGFQWMVPPFLTYEAVGVAIVGNFVKNANGAAFGVNGGFNVLIARNTATQVGATSHLLEVVFGGRSCDGQPVDEGRERCQQYLNASNMGWGTTGVDTDVRIPNNHVTIFGNCIVNEAPYKSEWQQFTIFGATGSQPGSNVPSNARADNDLLISRNIIWNGNADMPLGVGDDSCNNLICNSTQLVRDNSINVAKPELANATGGRMTCVDFPGILSQVRKPNWNDRPAGLPIAFEDWPGLAQ